MTEKAPLLVYKSLTLCVLCLFREIEMFHCCETIAIFIDIIWAASVKPSPFPVQNQRTDFARSLLSTCVHRFSFTLSPITKICLMLFQILFYVSNFWCEHCYVTIYTKLHQIYIILFSVPVKAGITWLDSPANLASKSCLDVIICDQNK